MSGFDVMETEDALEYRTELPEFDQDDIEVTVSGNQLTVTARHGELEDEEELGEGQGDGEDGPVEAYAVGESSDSFIQLVTLPVEADSAHVEAHFADGILTVRVAKSSACQVIEPPVE